MNSQSFVFKLAVLVGILTCITTGLHAQQESLPPSALTLSEPLHTTLYPEVMCVGCVVPEWNGGYLLHREIDKDPAVVTMYDKSGNKVLTGRISLLDYSNVFVLTESVTHAKGILAGAAGDWTDGTRQGFLAETDPRGRTVKSTPTPGFETHQVCEAADGTVWTLGNAWGPRDLPSAERNILRHYSFEKGLLDSFISVDSVAKSEGVPEVILPRRSYLHCGKDRVSVYFALSAQYIEVDTSSNKLSHWKLDMSSVLGNEPRGFAVTDNHRIFVAFSNSSRVEDLHGLYELRAAADNPIASLTPIGGTIISSEARNRRSENAVNRLWGADGNELVVQRHDSWSLSWVKVIESLVGPD
jgi:hypothetical protein